MLVYYTPPELIDGINYVEADCKNYEAGKNCIKLTYFNPSTEEIKEEIVDKRDGNWGVYREITIENDKVIVKNKDIIRINRKRKHETQKQENNNRTCCEYII